jgi:hypothetical protein
MANAAKKMLRLEMSQEMLKRLLTAGEVCAADFRYLDCESKQCLWWLCLESCAMKTGRDGIGEQPDQGPLSGLPCVSDVTTAWSFRESVENAGSLQKTLDKFFRMCMLGLLSKVRSFELFKACLTGPGHMAVRGK